jgi:hypothetical protein
MFGGSAVLRFGFGIATAKPERKAGNVTGYRYS